MERNDVSALIARVRDCGGIGASDEDVMELASQAERLFIGLEGVSDERDSLRRQLAEADRLSTALIRIGRLESELERARERLSIEMDRFEHLAEMIGDAGFQIGSVSVDATDFVSTSVEPDAVNWGTAWRDAIDAHLERMASVEYMERLADQNGPETKEDNGTNRTDS